MARQTTRQRLIAANHELRAMRTRLYDAVRSDLPLRSEIQGLQQELKRMTSKHEAASRRADACQSAFDAIVTALHEIRIATGKAAT